MEPLLALEMVRVTEAAAIASARYMGRGAKDDADRAATEAMRRTMDEIDMAGTIVIGEGERDQAPMLYIGEEVGRKGAEAREGAMAIDIAVDPLEGTNLVAHGQANAITVLAAAERGGPSARRTAGRSAPRAWAAAWLRRAAGFCRARARPWLLPAARRRSV